MRVEVISTTVTRRLHASAATARLPDGGLGGDARALAGRPAAVQDSDGDVRRDRREDRARVQHLGAEVGQLRRLRERQPLDHRRMVHDARIRGQHAVDVGPDLDLAAGDRGSGRRGQAVQGGTHQRARIVRAAATERRGRAGGGAADEPAQHRHEAGHHVRQRARAPPPPGCRSQAEAPRCVDRRSPGRAGRPPMPPARRLPRRPRRRSGC